MAGLVAAAAVIASLPTVTGGFFWDTPGLQSGGSLFIPFFDHLRPRSLFWLSMDLDRIVWGMWAPGYHLFNIALHAFNSVLLMFIARRVGLSLMVAAFAAGLFALHPVNGEAVGWVFGRAWLLMAMFSMTSFLLYLRYVADRIPAAAISSALFFLLALLSGQGAMVLLPLVALHAWSVRLARKNVLFVVLLFSISLLSYQYFFRGAGGVSQGAGLPGSGGVFDAFASLGFYLSRIVLPLGLKAFPILPGNLIFMIAGIMPLLVLYVLYSEGYRAEASGFGALLLLLLPAMVVAMDERSFPLGFRYAYLPSAAFCVLVAQWVGRVKNEKVSRIFQAVVLAAFAAGAVAGAVGWDDPAGMWQEAAHRHGNRALLHANHGAALLRAGVPPDEVARALERALAMDDLSDGLLQFMIRLYEASGEGGERRMYEALVSKRGKAHADYSMGFINYKRYVAHRRDVGVLKRAVSHLESAVAGEDSRPLAYYYLGMSYVEARMYGKAEHALLKTRELDLAARYLDETERVLALINSLDRAGLKNMPALPGWGEPAASQAAGQ